MLALDPAIQFADIALDHVTRECPNKVDHRVLWDSRSMQHAAVHGHVALTSLSDADPTTRIADASVSGKYRTRNARGHRHAEPQTGPL